MLLRTKAVLCTDAGWLLTDPKEWTSKVYLAKWGMCLARPNPASPKHKGVILTFLSTWPPSELRSKRCAISPAMRC